MTSSERHLPNLLVKWKLLELALRDPGLGRSRIPAAVFQNLIEHDGQKGVFIGRALLAEKCNVDRSRISKALVLLKERGYINWKSRWNEKKGKWDSNIYKINYDKVPDANEPAPLPECQEASALAEIAEYIRKTYFCGTNDEHQIAESICGNVREQSSTEFIGRRLFKLLRDAEKLSGSSSELDLLILDRL